MSYETVLLDHKGPVAILTLNRPKVLNALNAQMFDDLAAVVKLLRSDSDVRVLLVTGAGERAFAAGADIAELAKTDAASGLAFSRRGQQVFNELEELAEVHGVPSIALVNGFALGGGCELALACTLRIAGQAAKFGLPEVKLGVTPGYGGTQRLPRLIGRGAALRLMLTGEIVSAAEALRIGLVEEIVAARTIESTAAEAGAGAASVSAQAQLMARGHELAEAIVNASPKGVAGVLAAVGLGLEQTLSEGMEIEARGFGQLCSSEDKREGTAAFLEKRKAVWPGR